MTEAKSMTISDYLKDRDTLCSHEALIVIGGSRLIEFERLFILGGEYYYTNIRNNPAKSSTPVISLHKVDESSEVLIITWDGA